VVLNGTGFSSKVMTMAAVFTGGLEGDGEVELFELF